MTWHQQRLLAFDTETTGVDVETDRIVAACVAIIDGTGQTSTETTTWLVDPGIEIPAEATAVHGITTQHAREYGMQPEAALKEIAQQIADARDFTIPVVVYNAPYDLTILEQECRRHGVEPLDALPPIIDPFVLDKHIDPYRKGSRKLADVAAHYNAQLDGAHDATHDAIAAARIAWRIGQRACYPAERLMREFGYLHDAARRLKALAELSLADLHALQVKAKAVQDESFRKYLIKQGKPADGVDGSWPLRTTGGTR